MPGRKSTAAIDVQINALKKIALSKARYDRQCQELAQEIVHVLKKSGKSCRELMTFLHAPYYNCAVLMFTAWR